MASESALNASGRLRVRRITPRSSAARVTRGSSLILVTFPPALLTHKPSGHQPWRREGRRPPHYPRTVSRRAWWSGIALPVAVLVLYFVFPLDTRHAPVGVAVGLLGSLAALVVVTLVLLSEIRRSERRLGALQLVLALEAVVVVFAAVYYLVGGDRPQQFAGLATRLDALYFSMATLTTVGYGDVHPVGQLARGVVTAQLAFNLVFVGALARLVQERLSSRRTPERAEDT